MDLTSFELQIPTTSAKGEYLTSHLNQVMMLTLYRDRELREDYQNLLSVDPRLVDVLTRKQTDQAARLLTKGRESFRNCEIHSVRVKQPLDLLIFRGGVTRVVDG